MQHILSGFGIEHQVSSISYARKSHDIPHRFVESFKPCLKGWFPCPPWSWGVASQYIPHIHSQFKFIGCLCATRQQMELSTSTLQVLVLICNVMWLRHTQAWCPTPNGVAIWWQPQTAFVLRDCGAYCTWCLCNPKCWLNRAWVFQRSAWKVLLEWGTTSRRFPGLSGQFWGRSQQLDSAVERYACGPGIPGEFEFQPGYTRLSTGLHHWIAGGSFQSLEIWQVRRQWEGSLFVLPEECTQRRRGTAIWST